MLTIYLGHFCIMGSLAAHLGSSETSRDTPPGGVRMSTIALA